MCGAIVSGLHSISIDERYIARSTWMCGAIVTVLHNARKIATGCADPSYSCTRLHLHCIRLWKLKMAQFIYTLLPWY